MLFQWIWSVVLHTAIQIKQVLFEIRSLLILLLTLLTGAAFQLVKNGDWQTAYPYFCNEYNFLCVSDVALTRDTFVWFFFQDLNLIIFAIEKRLSWRHFPTAENVFIGIQVVTLIDYLLTYGKTWTYIDAFPISWNIFKVVIFILAIFYEVLKIIEAKWMNSYET